ncbi:hypothetical protein [Nocardia sp. NBC_01327]|uniref:hypothetical protein n=1 Tax=Nocardia sp. NBC_01327 TaxID=2903593 RepID=UPI002E0E901C|nr:hypothetical protein OG326_00270 [Nocardia sp. NBC_01327]
MKNTKAHRIGAVTAGIAALTAAVALAAPFAAADVTNNGLTLSGSAYQTGQTYQLSFDGSQFTGASYSVYDNVNNDPTNRVKIADGFTTSAHQQISVNWTPNTVGAHSLWVAIGYLSAATPEPGPVNVTVTQGTSSGSSLTNLLGSLSG